jgi:membrane-bound lytic murein transglycosylase B
MVRVHLGSVGRVTIGVVAGTALAVAALSLAVVRFGSATQHGTAADPLAAVVAPTAAAPVSSARERTGSRSATRGLVDRGWVSRLAAATGIPAPAMRAYGAATLLLSRSEPGCHLGWTTLAGIGQVESGHGAGGGRSLGEDGRSSTPVLGPALDGSGGVAALRSTAGSQRWHGDPTWEHAVGPMQFLASTWDRWGADGDGDGTADPLDLDDAAYAAGRYLCADGHDLATSSGWNAAVLSYNHDPAYVLAVNAAAVAYAARA